MADSAARRPVAFAFYLGLAMAVGPLVHYALSALGPLVVEALDLSATSFGLLWFVTFAFAGLFTVTGGKLTDAFGARAVLTVAFGLGLVAMLATAGASSFWWLAFGIAVSGVTQALANPATNALVASGVPAAKQGLALGIKQSGVQASQFVAGLALPTLALLLGWRQALLACCLLAAVGLTATRRLVPVSAPRTGGRLRRRGAPLGAAVKWMAAYAFLMGAMTQASNVYLPLYAHRELGASVTTAGLIMATYSGVGIVARLVWGGLSKGPGRLHLALSALAVLAWLAMAAFYFAGSAEWLVWAGAAMFSFSAVVPNVIIILSIVRTVPGDAVGHATAWASLGMYAGFMVGPVSFGWLVDTASFRAAWLGCIGVATTLLLVTAVWWRTERSDVTTGRTPA